MKFTVGNLLLLNREEEERQLYEWNATKTIYPSESCIHHLFSERVRIDPKGVAVIAEGGTYSYEEIDDLSDQVAVTLIEANIKPQSFILISLPPSVDLIVGILGILKAGCVYVPVNMNAPQKHIQFVLEDTKAEALITTSDLKERYLGFCNHVMSFEDFVQEKEEALTGLIKPEHLAYVVYSSGIQQPKGIAVTHNSLVNSIYARHLYFSLSVKGIALLQSIDLDITSTIIFWALSEGASLVIPRNFNMQDEVSVLQFIKEQRITHLLYSSVLYMSLLKKAKEEDLKSLEVVSLRGESWHPGLLEKHLQICPQANLYNEYGLMEATTWSSIAQIYDHQTKEERRITIGCPIANTQMYILNERRQLVPVGVKGEIYIGGAGLARGYLNQPELTRSCFVEHPYEKDKRLCRTGDTGCYLEDGSIEYIGRIDRQIDILGHQVEPEKIEQVLRQHPKVEEAVVLLRKVQSGQEQLVGYVQWEGGKPSQTQEIEKDLEKNVAKQLPAYMIPQAWVFVETFKVTPAGKRDREDLPDPTYERASQDDMGNPRTENEQQLAAIWCELLQLDRVSIKDNFFEVGGDSILSIQLVSKARQVSLEINMEQVFEFPTIEELAQLAKVSSKKPISELREVIVDKQAAPLAPIQAWFLEQKENDVHHYNQAVLLEALEELDGECLERGLQSLLKVHSSLRLRFEEDEEGAWKQSYETYEALAEYRKGVCRVEHLDSLSEEEAAVRRLEVMEEVQRSLNITKGPVFQGVLFKGSQEQGDSLFLVAHHLVVDSVSWRILIEDLEDAYQQAIEKKEEIHLEPEPRSYGWWSQELQTLSQKEAWKQEIGYWEKVLEGCQAQLLRELPGKGPNTVESMGEVTVELSEEETRQLLQEVPKSYRTQINDVLLTALGYAVKEWTGSGRVSLMLEGHGREQLTEEMDLSRTVGWFTSIYPVNIDLEGAEELGTGIKRVKEYLRNIPKKGIGYGMLRYLTQEGQERLDSKKEPEFSFNYLGQLDTTIQQKSLFGFAEGSIGACIALKNQRPRLLEINCQVMNGRLSIHVGYGIAYHQKETIQALGENYIQWLKKIVLHCCQEKHFGYTPSDFPLAKLEQEQIDQVFGSIPVIEDIYPLSPMQEGLLFQKLYQPNSEAYFIQAAFTVDGPLNVETFKQAWGILVNKFSILRTGFKWAGLEQPLQFVVNDIPHEVYIEDWQKYLDPSRELMKYLKRLKTQDYSFENPPLMKMYLLKLSSEKHYMIWSFHHIILDGWCTSILIGELVNIYTNIKNAQEASPKPRPYKDYIAWLYKQDISEAEGFWKRHLLESKKTILLLTPFTNDTVNEKYEMSGTSIPKYLASKLIIAAKKYKVTLSDIFQFAWGFLLSHYTQEDDIIFGITVSGRSINLTGIEDMLGLFINTLPQRIKITKANDLQSTLQSIHNQLIQMQRFAHVPLAKIQSLMDGYDGHNIFNTLFLFESLKERFETSADSRIRIEGITTNEQVEYPLTILVQAEDEQVDINFYYITDYFQKAHVEQLVRHYIHILTQIATQENPKLSSLEVFDDIEKQALLDRWKGGKTSLSEISHFFDCFDKNVERYSDKAAVADKSKTISYKSLYFLSNKVAEFLTRLNVNKDTPICIYFDRSNEYLVSLLGVWRAGAIYVPIDPRIPLMRIEGIIEQLDNVIVITDKKYFSNLKESNLKHLYCIEDILEQKSPKTNKWKNPDFSQVAYIIYTSGSTGDPKGVMVEHLAMHNHLNSKIEVLQLSKDDNVAQTASQSFDVSVWQFVAPLMVGAKVIIIEDDAVINPEQLSNRIFNNEVTVMGTVPSLLSILLDGLEYDPNLQIKLKSLRWVMPSGEAFSVSLYKRWSNLFPNIKVINAYGPTECGDDVTHHIVTSIDETSNTIPINGTIQNMDIYVADEDIRPVPYGTVGELYVGGVGLARGYYALPDQTQTVFIKNPFEDGKRLYRTGDLVTTRADGTIFFIGRKDKQIKINGCRIEIGEIESALLRYPKIKDVCVHLDKYEGISRLVAYYIPKAEPIAKDKIGEFLLDKLIDYMQPKYFIPLAKFPLTTSGKIDLKKLPSPQNDFDSEKKVNPRDNIETKLFAIWRDILKVDRLSIFDSFMNLGGHSLLVVRMALQVRKTFNVNIPINEITGKLTIAELAKKVTSSLQVSNSPIITIQESKKNLPLFIVHPISGLASSYEGLSDYIKECSIYGINDPCFGETGHEHQSLQEMATKYLDIIASIQLEGPYRLAGWSFGGLVALEMASQLTRSKVSDVILIDTYHPEIVKTDDPESAARELLQQDGISINSIEGQHFFETIKKNERLMYNYKPVKYSGRTTLLKSQSPELLPNAGWTRKILPHLNVYYIEGTHFEMFREPYIKSVADKIKEILNVKN